MALDQVLLFILDLSGHILRRCLIVYLLHGLLEVKGRYAGRERWVEAGFVVATTLFQMANSYLPALKILLYGNENGVMESRATILPLFISLSLMLAYGFWFYSGKRSRIFYLIFTVYTLNELTTFILHSLFSVMSNGYFEALSRFITDENEFVLRNYESLFTIFQLVWNGAFHAIAIVILFKAVKSLKGDLAFVGRNLTGIQELFLVVPSVAGLCFCLLLRSVLFAYKGDEARFLMDEYPETKLLIPVISALCLFSILLSAAILRRLVESSEKEMLVEVCQNQISDMEEHMKDVERLYDGIRGMRHDMKNYVADLEVLLEKDFSQTDGFPGEGRGSEGYRKEIRSYLDGLCHALEDLDMKCNTGNPVTDVVVSRKMRRAGQGKIPFACEFIFPEGFGISAFDISILLNNGLDNALEASEKETRPYIRLESYAKGNMFFIEIRNAFTGSLDLDDSGKILRTSKADNTIGCKDDPSDPYGLNKADNICYKDDLSHFPGQVHGLGVKNMINCAEKYYGTVRWESRRGEFLLAIMLQGKGDGGKNEQQN